VKSLRVDIYQFMKFVVPTGIDAGGYLGPALHPISLLFFLLHGFVPRGCSSQCCPESLRKRRFRAPSFDQAPGGQIKSPSNRVASMVQAVSGADPGSGPPFLETRYFDDFLVRVKPRKFHEPLSLFKN
jgi:hypothetical protein